MCWHLTIGIAKEGASAVTALAGRTRQVIAADPRASGFPAAVAAFLLTSGGCSCDLYRGGPVERETLDRARARLEARHRAKGWSQAKIERALAAAKLPGERALPTALYDIVRDLVDAHGAVHLCARDASVETPLGPAQRMTLAQLREAHGAFPPNAPIEITLVPQSSIA